MYPFTIPFYQITDLPSTFHPLLKHHAERVLKEGQVKLGVSKIYS